MELHNELTLDRCILSIIKKEGFITYDITKKELHQDGGNFISRLYEVEVNGKTDKEQKTTSIFVKTMGLYSADIERFSVQACFEREKFVYKELSKIFDKMQNEATIPEEKRFKMIKSYDETQSQMVFLENIARRGFRTWFRMDVITLDYAEQCIKSLARFHGLSFALEIKHTDYFNSAIKPMKTLTRSEKHEAICDFFMPTVLEMLDSCVKDRLGSELRHLLGKFNEYVTGEDTICCLCHSDYRPNNIMHKTMNGRVTEVIPVDYQFSYYGCPVIDIINFIYLSTDHQFREDHQQYLKDLYHETLTEFLNYFNVSVDSVFSKTQLEELYEKKKDYGLITTLLMGPLVFTDEFEFKNNGPKSKIVIDDRYKVRLLDAIKEFYDI